MSHNDSKDYGNFRVKKSESEWKEILTPEQYRILRQKGTERPYSGEYNVFYKKGQYACTACGNVLFTSDTKFDSHCGWPSFYDALDKTKIKEIEDNTLGMSRIEVVCADCGGHLGHVFNDGPKPTGLRYCINSVSIQFVDESKNEDKKNNDSLETSTDK
ncbi:MAG: peptide-methionine (R)-S-oxide reductase MsrB [Candidatus Kapaibacteriota bacterium]|jgi:peptide-methionine (R)-S-oxide reductase